MQIKRGLLLHWRVRLEPPLVADTRRGVNAFYSAIGILTRQEIRVAVSSER